MLARSDFDLINEFNTIIRQTNLSEYLCFVESKYNIIQEKWHARRNSSNMHYLAEYNSIES